jgi:rhamnosyltransferase
MVDIIIPVYRPDDKLEKLIDKLNEQTVQPEHIFFMQTLTGTEEDSRVRKILNRARRGEIHTLNKKDFDHGGTRNRGAALSEAEYMLFMTQDAVPVDERLVEKLLDAMTPETVATAYGRQLAGEDAGVIENYTRQFNYPPESSRKSAADLPRLGIKTYFCSNACAMYKKKVYDELGGFVLHTIFNEDMIMASKVIGAGYQIAYCGEAAVVHSHKYTYRQQFSRNFDLAVSQRQYREIFDNVKSETEGIRMVKDTAKYLLSQGKWFLVPDLIFQSGFKFLGYRFGKKYDRLPMWMVRRFSMNKAYWRESE